MRQPLRYVRLVYELLFSLYCAALFVVTGDAKGGIIYYGLRVSLRALDRILFPLLHRLIFTYDAADVFYSSWVFVAILVFACMRTLGRTPLVSRIVPRWVGAVVVVCGTLYYSGLRQDTFLEGSERHLMIAQGLLWLEATVVVGCVLLYLYRRWPMYAALGILVLLLHFGFWGSIIFGPDLRDYLRQSAVFVLLPLCTSLVWGLYVRLPAGSQPSAEVPT